MAATWGMNSEFGISFRTDFDVTNSRGFSFEFPLVFLTVIFPTLTFFGYFRRREETNESVTCQVSAVAVRPLRNVISAGTRQAR